MDKRVIYPTKNGGVAVVIPSPEWLAIPGNTIEKLAEKDVPSGVEYKIVDKSEIPSDIAFRGAWEYQA